MRENNDNANECIMAFKNIFKSELTKFVTKSNEFKPQDNKSYSHSKKKITNLIKIAKPI